MRSFLAGSLLLLMALVPVLGQTFYTPPQDRGGMKAPDVIDPKLPNVLIIGDSISLGYTPVVRKLLAGKANVIHIPANGGNTEVGLKDIDEWLGTRKWAVIHFNWGLHDINYISTTDKGKRDKLNGTITTTPEQYEKNLETLVTRMEKTGAKLIWASTTVVPENEVGRIVGDEKKYNDIAARVMQRHGIPTDDLYSLTVSFHGAYSAGPGNVHYKAAGNALNARQVADSIEKALVKAGTTAPKPAGN